VCPTISGFAKFIKINDYEYKRSENFIDKNITSKIIHTMGSNGCQYNGINYSVDKVEVKDVSGAGDTFLAGLVVKYYETKDINQSINFANKCASKVVRQKGDTVL
jgi:D-beta-D-heptose 7-phosphate kinase/D-beta-D-heptose 1-phosphate adenosyltransferase